MDALQQHMLDSYRATRLGELPPPPPGRHDWETAGTLARGPRRYDHARPARRRWRTALREAFGGRSER